MNEAILKNCAVDVTQIAFVVAATRFLHAFEDFYRKLGSTMGTNITRPSRSRPSSGRNIPGFRDRDRPQSMSPKSPRGSTPFSKRDVKKEDTEAVSDEVCRPLLSQHTSVFDSRKVLSKDL